MKKDLKAMSRKELEKLLSEVKQALVNAQARDQREARKAAEKAAAEFGFTLGELSDGQKPRRGRPKGKTTPVKKGAPKYRNPDDPSQTWTGKGRRPTWYLQKVDAGIKPETMAI